jgi:hypothetical protein
LPEKNKEKKVAVKFVVEPEEPTKVIPVELVQDGNEVHLKQADGDELYLVSITPNGIRIWSGLENLGLPMRGDYPKVIKE